MVSGLSEWNRCPEHIARHRSRGGGSFNTGLSVLTPDEEGSDRRAYLWFGRCEDQSPCPPVRDDDGRSSGREGRQDHEQAEHGDSGRLRAGDDRDGGYGVGHEANRLSALKSLNTSQLPHVSDGHWRQTLKAASETARERLRNGDDFLSAPEALEANTSKALEVTYELMHADHRDHDDGSSLVFNRINKVRLSAASTVLNTQVRVNDLQLKKQAQDDTLKLVLARMKEEQARLAIEPAI